MPLTRSTFANGSYRDGNWFCACNNQAIWRAVSKDGPTQNQRFLRCNISGRPGPQCNFFLWEAHEAAARNQVTQREYRPITPPSSSNSGPSNALYLPTPSPGNPSSSLLTRDRWLPAPDESPTRHRGTNATTYPVAVDYGDEQDDEGTILSQIVARLGIDGIQLRQSTKEYLGNLLREEIAIYEAKLRSKEVTIARLSRILDQQMRNDNIKVEP